ncbi:DUF1566 domain-containing protein [Lacinutrix sp. MedPE-SW]|uniref:DUF1566 domain-containing protein n=1 Tax=Lacinutrix sp. MedPE-SW TaxID=1860087 RepID=UPI0009205FC1|nr:DUF1566 domain-containing protein [Lacinutrix sp. MedPE-SW]OIQ23862.1 MAG: hypothetical protein BM549_00730 [Lacinutrix sp. MedPE-SW]
MDEIYKIITSSAFSIIAPLILGVLASWYISKHFFYKKQPSVLQLAKRLKNTNFGNYYNLTQEITIRVLETKYFGKWHIKSNGTITDTKHNLCWIRAPWGTIWNGNAFEGKPIAVNWRDASSLFGEGIYREYYKNTKEINELDISKKNYKKGNCTVTFANNSNWRLPTSLELETLHYKNAIEVNNRDEYSNALLALKTELFPGFKLNPKNFNVWSADQAGSNCAWISNELYCQSDEKISSNFFVLFVRSISNKEIEKERKLLVKQVVS